MSSRKSFVDTRTVLQVEPTECGAACLSMILQYFGQYVSLEQLRMETDVSRDGCSAGNIVRAAQRRGLQCEGFRRSADQLAKMDPPCILWWEHNHFVVYEGMRSGECLINDPAYGKRRISMQTLAGAFSGIVLTFSPESSFRDFPEYGKKPKTYLQSGRIQWMFRSHGARSAAAIAAGILSLAAVLAAAVAPEFFLSHHLQTGSGAGTLMSLLGICLVCYLAGAFICEHHLRRLKDTVELRGSWVYLHTLFDMPVAFLQQRSPEDLVERIRRNDEISRFTAETYLRGIIGGAGILLCLLVPVFMAILSPQHAASSLLILLVMLLMVFLVFLNRAVRDRRTVHEGTRAAIRDAELASTVLSGTGRIETIRSLGLGRKYTDKAAEQLRKSAETHRRLQGADIAEKAIRYGLYSVCMIAFLLILWILPEQGDVKLYTWMVLFVVLIPAMESFLDAASQLRRINDEIQTVDDITAAEREETVEKEDAQPAEQFRRLHGNIRCHQAAFAYGTFGERIIDDLNLYLPVGSSLAVTGPSGSGKSTVAKLFGGLLEPTGGMIMYDGKPVSEIPDQVVYASISMVKQKSELFAGSIRDNITMWNPYITAEDLAQAIADACVEECVLRRAKGMDTLLGERGSGLSGGEQQRIEIARALATNPSILILDEAFTAIDDETTEQIMANIRRRGCTCILITHDPLLIGGCSQVLDLRESGGGV